MLSTPAAMAKKGDNRQPTPVQMDLREIQVASAGLPTDTETFAGFPEFAQPNDNLQLVNGTYYGGIPFILGETLYDNTIETPRMFTNFPPGTRFWGADLLAGDAAEFDIVVVGNSGVLVLTAVRGNQLDGFLGFHDPQGLVSVAVQTVDGSSSGGSDVGLGNYGFDNVTTAGWID